MQIYVFKIAEMQALDNTQNNSIHMEMKPQLLQIFQVLAKLAITRASTYVDHDQFTTSTWNTGIKQICPLIT
jgi:hypothetical protein